MKLKKTLLGAALVLASAVSLTSCGQKKDADNNSNAASGESAKGSVYYLNFKPEVEEVWNKIAKTYTDETGVPVKLLLLQVVLMNLL